MEGAGMKMIKVKMMSPAVMSRARNGHRVRLMKGEGTQLVVSPDQYSQIEKAFLKNKGIQVALSTQEIDANKMIEGSGIFGKKFDKGLKKAGIKKFVYKAASAVKPLAMELIDKGAEAASMFAPELAPAITMAQSTAKQYLDKPSSLQGKKGVKELKRRALEEGVRAAAPLAAEYGIDVNEMKAMLESGSDVPMSRTEMRAKGEDAVLGQLQQMVDARRSRSAPAPVSTDLYSQFDSDGILGNGMKGGCKHCPMCSGSGLYAGAASGRGMPGMAPMRKISTKFVDLSRKLMGGELQALDSQAMDANFAFRRTLAPQYQRG
jgi:hypothetical protein